MPKTRSFSDSIQFEFRIKTHKYIMHDRDAYLISIWWSSSALSICHILYRLQAIVFVFYLPGSSVGAHRKQPARNEPALFCFIQTGRDPGESDNRSNFDSVGQAAAECYSHQLKRCWLIISCMMIENHIETRTRNNKKRLWDRSFAGVDLSHSPAPSFMCERCSIMGTPNYFMTIRN